MAIVLSNDNDIKGDVIFSDISRPQSVAYTKAVYGVSVDPHQEYRIASYVDVSHTL